MNQSTTNQGLKLETPATYRIRVQGHLDSSWSDRLGGMAITQIIAEDKTKATILVGHLRDQAALAGVLNALYGLHMPLLSVENLDEK
ncbi:MAG: hypothetical protein JRK53_20655 [Deltaproteobacteria bacterium]|nr:hypothetical protein [Deltaproteobacteria bacterium]